ncbi:MAG TPA: patatin-like phospholipase family protein [Bradyrhizobium sp.]|jgi:NTE family protein|nr:patatin-like phospholipase family protein [Bradyrhizobium sp.]
MTATPKGGHHPRGLAGIEFLTLEGGGGKGGAYLGAVIALEELGLLPIKATGKRQIRGIAGASAGAATAFLLAIGQTSENMWKSIIGQEFLDFLDGPEHGVARSATFIDDTLPAAAADRTGGKIKRTVKIDLNDRTKLPATVIKTLVVLVALLQKDHKAKTGDHIADLIAGTILKGVSAAGAKSKAYQHIATAIKKDPGGYLMNLAFDPGIFPAFAVREFLARQLVVRLKVSVPPPPPSTTEEDLLKLAKRLTFEQFFDLTKVDLVVAGTNLSTGRPAYFSRSTTAKFPVVDAVGLSMSIPIFFKALYLDTKDKKYDAFRGWWGDGGIVNNFPLHAFNGYDSGGLKLDSFARGSLPINPATLGLVLDDGDVAQFGVEQKPMKDFPGSMGLIGPVLDALMFTSTEGQIRNANERNQTVRLNAFFLGTYDLAVDPVVVAASVPEARAKIYDCLLRPRPAASKAILKTLNTYVTANLKALAEATKPKYCDKVKRDWANI